MENPNDILLSKWLQNTISEDELQLLAQEYDLDTLSQILKKQESLEFELIPEHDMWAAIEGKLSDKQLESESDTAKFKSKTSRSSLLAFIFGVFALGALLFYFFRPTPGEINIKTKPAEQRQQIIAENTAIDLAPGSSLIYNKETWQDNREVKLTGQAFFDVSKGEKFTVITSIGNVEVLGTEFEVWERDGILKVSCYEGKVKVMTVGGQSKEITVGERVMISKGRLGTIEKHDAKQPGFLTGRVSYDKIELSSLAKEIERFYNVSVDTKRVENTKSFSGVLISDDIEKSCSYIAETLDLKYETGNQKIEFYSE